MVVRLLLAGFLLAHGLIHASFLAPRPLATAGGSTWPFELKRSWLLSRLGVEPELLRVLGLTFVAATAGGFALAAIAALGFAPAGVFAAAVALGSMSSFALLVVFFQPWLVLGLVIDLVLLWAVLVANWAPSWLSG